MADTMRFTIIGDDRLTPALDRAGRSAGQLDRQLDQVGTHGGESINEFVTDSSGRLRTLDGRFASAGLLAEHGLGEGVERGTRRARGGLGGLLPLIGRLGSMGGSVLSVVAPVGKLAAGVGAAVPLVAGLVATVEQLAPAAGVAATGILAVASAAAVVKLGMVGVGDAVKAAFDPGTKAKDLKAALDKLAPSARAFVLQLRSMKPEFTRLQLGVQNTLFAGLAAHVKTLGASALPLLRTQLGQTAGTLNLMALGVTDTATSLADSGVFGRALSGANKGLRNLAGIPGQVVAGLGQIAAAAAPSFDKLTAGAGNAVTKISDKLSTAFSSGGMQKAIDKAVDLARQFGRVLGNIGTILQNVFAQVPAGGAGLIGFLGTITSTLAKVTALPGVQAAFGDLFTVMAEVGKVAAPLIGQALKVLGPVITTLAPPVLRLVDSLGAGLGPIITALGPVLLAAAGAVGALLDAVSPLLPLVGQVIVSLGPVLTPILGIIGDLFTALAPVLLQLGKSLVPPLAKITITLAKAFTEMAPVLDKALTQLGQQGLMPIVMGLATVIGQLVTQYADQFLTMFRQLLPVIPVLIPVVLQLAKSIGQILVAVAPLLPQILLLSTQFLTALLPAVIPLLPIVAQFTILLLKLATGTITKVVVPALSGLIKFVQGMKHKLQPLIDAATWVTQHVAGAFRWLYDTLLGHSIIPDLINGAVKWFAGLPGRAGRALANLASTIAGKVRDAANRMISAIKTGLSTAVSWVHGLPGRAKTALGDLGSYLYKSGQSLIRGFIHGITSMAKSAGSAASSVLGKVKGFFPNSPAKEGPFSGAGWTLYSGQAVMRDWAAGISTGRNGVVSAVGAVASAAAGALPNQMAMPGVGLPAGAAAGGPGGIQATFNIATLDPLSAAKEVRRMLLELKRVYGLNIDLGLGGTA